MRFGQRFFGLTFAGAMALVAAEPAFVLASVEEMTGKVGEDGRAKIVEATPQGKPMWFVATGRRPPATLD